MKKLWFAAKEYGWGWYPVTWQGWLVLGVFIVLMIANAFRLHVSNHSSVVPTEFLVETVVLVAVLIGICFWRGEKPAWRWGRKNNELKNKLTAEGFPIVYEWTDAPGTIYEDHAHHGRVSFYVTRGSVTFSGGIHQTVSAGERIDVPVGVRHTAVVGSEGCEYVVGQEIEGDA